jgi:hypothetical protein
MKFKRGDKITSRNMKGTIVHVDENPAVGLPYLCVFIKGSRTSAQWLGGDDLALESKFKVGDVVVNGNGLEYTIVSMCDSDQEKYTMITILNKNTVHADVCWFTKDGVHCLELPNSLYNLIPNEVKS